MGVEQTMGIRNKTLPCSTGSHGEFEAGNITVSSVCEQVGSGCHVEKRLGHMRILGALGESEEAQIRRAVQD